MRGLIRRLREWTPAAGGGATNDRLGLAAGLLTLAVCIAADFALTSESAAIVGAFVAAPFVAALLAGPVATAAVGVAAIGAAAAEPRLEHATGDSEQIVRLIVIAAWHGPGGRRRLDPLAIGGPLRAPAAARLGRRGRRRLAAAGRDPAPGDRGGRAGAQRHLHGRRDPRRAGVSRIATRASGRADSSAIEERMRNRPPALPQWLVEFERSWRHIPQWWPRVRDEELRRMAARPTTLSSCARSACAPRS